MRFYNCYHPHYSWRECSSSWPAWSIPNKTCWPSLAWLNRVAKQLQLHHHLVSLRLSARPLILQESVKAHGITADHLHTELVYDRLLTNPLCKHLSHVDPQYTNLFPPPQYHVSWVLLPQYRVSDPPLTVLCVSGPPPTVSCVSGPPPTISCVLGPPPVVLCVLGPPVTVLFVSGSPPTVSCVSGPPPTVSCVLGPPPTVTCVSMDTYIISTSATQGARGWGSEFYLFPIVFIIFF